MHAARRSLLIHMVTCIAAAGLACAAAGLGEVGVAHATPVWHRARALGRDRPLRSPARKGRGARSPTARVSIVGGNRIEAQQAPWQATVFAEFEAEGEIFEIFCGGSIIDLSHVLTAAHCLYNPETGQPLPAGAFFVAAGASSITEEGFKSIGVQARFVTAARPHPYFDYAEGPGTPDDVAVLTLAEPLERSAYVQSIGLTPSGSTLPEGTAVEIAGFGAQSPNELNNNLYSVGMTLGFPRQCGEETDAVFLCTSSPTGSTCVFDEGGGLTTGSPPVLVGVLSTFGITSSEECGDGTINGFANLAAPEARDFVLEGSEAPPRAPRGGTGIKVAGVLTVGKTLTCTPGRLERRTHAHLCVHRHSRRAGSSVGSLGDICAHRC